MINRNLLRIKIIQILYSYYKNSREENDFGLAQEELALSIDKTYELYHYFFHLILNITDLAKKRLTWKSLAKEELAYNRLLADNKFVKQLEGNLALKSYLEEHDVDWGSEESNAVNGIHKQIIESDLMREYAEKTSPTYADDKELWRSIIRHIISESELLGKELEDLCIYWNDDANIVLSFVSKTIRNFEQENGDEQPLLPKFKDEEDEKFAYTLFKKSVYNANDYKEMIAKHTKNWDADRIAFLDTIIMQAALAEICSFPSIPVSVSMNEYLELAKSYSTPRSSIFINGILDAVVKELTDANKITKVAYISNYNNNKKQNEND